MAIIPQKTIFKWEKIESKTDLEILELVLTNLPYPVLTSVFCNNNLLFIAKVTSQKALEEHIFTGFVKVFTMIFLLKIKYLWVLAIKQNKIF